MFSDGTIGFVSGSHANRFVSLGGVLFAVNGAVGHFLTPGKGVRNYGGDLEICRGAALTRDDFEVVLF